MKIDYELAEKIGATHYRECSDGSIDFYKFINGIAFCRNSVKDEGWEKSISTAGFLVKMLKPIPPKPPVRVEYEKVDHAHPWQCYKEHEEKGNVFIAMYDSDGDVLCGDWVDGHDMGSVQHSLKSGNVYRRIEKPVDWRDEVKELMHKFGETSPYTSECEFDDDGVLINATFTEDEFKELCCSVAEAIKHE